MIKLLQEKFKSLGFKTELIADEILLIENYISQEHIDSYFDIINNTKEDDWFIHYIKNLKDFCMIKFGRDDLDNLVKEGKIEITRNWNDKTLNVSESEVDQKATSRFHEILGDVDQSLELSGFGTIQRMQPGAELVSHTDQKTDPSIKYAAVLYLNDDYTDGEIFFHNKGVTLKPKPGTLLVFPGNEEFEHGVKHVGQGPIRYVLPGFIKIKNFYKKH